MGGLIIYFLPTILALGLITSYEDIREGKIRNKYIIAAFVLSIATHAILYFFGMILLKNILDVLLSAIIALIIGVLLWHFGWWGAGDAKLYAAFAALMPHQQYLFKTTYVPSIDLLFNAILPLFIFLLFQIIIKTTNRQKKKFLMSAIEPKKLGITLLLIFSLGWLIRLALIISGVPPDYLTIILILIIAYKIIVR